MIPKTQGAGRPLKNTHCMKRVSTFTTWLLATLLLVVPMAPGAVRADDAQSLLAKHKAFVGWQYGDGSVQSLRLESAYTDASGKVTQHVAESYLGLASRSDYESSADYHNGASSGFTGRIFWTTSENGFTAPITGDTAKYLLTQNVIFSEGSTELPAALQGSATINGKSVSILRITMNGALPFDVYEDPETGAYLRAVVDPGGAYELTINISSYADLGPGKKMIGSWSYGDSKGKYTYTKLQLNPSVAPNDLHPPAPSATWTFANSQPFPIKVTPTRIYVDAKINGVPGRFILDTGASNIALTDDFANRANVKTIDHSKEFGIGGVTKDLVREADTLELGGNTLSHVLLSSLNITFNDAGNFEKPDGLIGFDVFGGAIVDLTLSNQTMRITDPSAGPAAAPQGGVAVPVDLSDLVPRVAANVDGKLPITAMLDTGGSNLVLISSEAEHHGVALLANRQGFLGANAGIGGIGGGELTVCGPMARITVGPFNYTGTEACESRGLGLHDGLIGFDFLRHFDYIFDYPHGALYMIPHND